MSQSERVALVRAMETVARAVNDEELFIRIWLELGVADGDIDETTTDEELDYYITDESFRDLMDTFMYLMSKAYKSGGLYCDGVLGGVRR